MLVNFMASMLATNVSTSEEEYNYKDNFRGGNLCSCVRACV
jgi:hypothetical protein